jgi:hypothetical protein
MPAFTSMTVETPPNFGYTNVTKTHLVFFSSTFAPAVGFSALFPAALSDFKPSL